MKVARTRSRPIPSGQVTKQQALGFLVAQGLVGFLVLIQFNWFTIGLGAASLVLVAIYPFMKRVTWWPQLFLGFAFSWGAMMGWAAKASILTAPPLLLYAGCILWVIGYDTIYACQDIEDDVMVGVRSTARLFGERTKTALVMLYAGALLLFAIAFWLAGLLWPAWAGLGLAGCHMAWQVRALRTDDPANCLALFKSNSHLGWVMFAGLVAAALL
jgi:4-hydroxybenzoate polyprenyltransferase